MNEEIELELEALESIYGEDYSKISQDTIQIHLIPNPDGSDNFVGIDLEITFSEEYPNKLPLYLFHQLENISEEQEKEIFQLVKQTGEESLGSPMVYNIAAAIKSWLDDNNVDPEIIRKQEIFKEEERKQKKRQDGTPVNAQTFLAWRDKFYTKYLADEKKEEEERKKRPTGRQLFETNAELATSDASFFEEEGGETVEVDWSVFSNELDDEFEEEES